MGTLVVGGGVGTLVVGGGGDISGGRRWGH